MLVKLWLVWYCFWQNMVDELENAIAYVAVIRWAEQEGKKDY